MKKTVLWFLKAAAAGVIALVAASAVCIFYSNPPIRVENETGATDYKWESNRFAATMTEGIAFIKTDENGFYNIPGAKSEGMDILAMGSSHMEGGNIQIEENIPYLMQEATGKSVYNIGTSGHTLIHCVKNLDSAFKTMKPTQYVIIETGGLAYSEEQIRKCLDGEMKGIETYDKGIVYQLQKIPYLRLAYSQLQLFAESGASDGDSAEEKYDFPREAYAEMLEYIAETCEKAGVTPIIFYHPRLTLNSDGTASPVEGKVTADEFGEVCAEKGIIFVDMAEDFMEMYKTEHKLPHGFCNTYVGVGHLNRDGKRVIADRLIAVVNALDAGKEAE